MSRPALGQVLLCAGVVAQGLDGYHVDRIKKLDVVRRGEHGDLSSRERNVSRSDMKNGREKKNREKNGRENTLS